MCNTRNGNAATVQRCVFSDATFSCAELMRTEVCVQRDTARGQLMRVKLGGGIKQMGVEICYNRHSYKGISGTIHAKHRKS